MSNFTKPNGGVLRGTAMALTDLPSIATGTALANISGSSTTPTAVSLVSTATASSIMLRDTNANVQTNNFIEGYASTATAASTTTLTVGSAYQQFFTGTTTQTVVLPVTSTLVLGQQFLITNASSGIVTVQSSGANTVIAQPGSSSYHYTCVLTSGTTAASWYAVPYSGGGAVTPTVTTLTSGSGTFTTPSNALYIQVEMIGGGGGGSGSGAGAGTGGTGGNTTFGSSLLVANGGVGGVATAGVPGGAGGTASLGSGPIGIALTGTQGSGNNLSSSSALAGNYVQGGAGGNAPGFSGGAGLGPANAAGEAGAANTGGGGGGGSTNGSTSQNSGTGGGSGGYIKAIIINPSATYAYAVGGGGAGGTSGTSSFAGGAGGSGVIIITTFYNNGAVGTATNVTGVVAKANGGTGSATYPGDYYASVYYPGSGTNYWSNANTSIGDFTATGTIPSPSTFVNSNFGTISKATSSLPGINFSAPRTGTIKITVRGMFQQNTSGAQNTIALIESTTSTTLDNITFNYNTLAADNQPQLLLGYFPATASTTYNFKLQSFSSAGTLTINSGVTSASMLTFSMEYIN